MMKCICNVYKKFKKNQPVIAWVNLYGVIGGSSKLSSNITFDSVHESIEQAFTLPKVKTVVVSVNSPGGSPVQSELIFNYIKELSAKHKVPVLTVAEDVAASGGYFILCAGDEIFASNNSIIGSIGVISAGFGLHETIKKLGVERRIYTQGNNKSILDPFLPEKSSDIDIIKSVQKDIYESFKDIVLSSRGDKLDIDHDKIFSGEFWSGKTAISLGLIDSTKSIRIVLKERFGEDLKIMKVSKPKSWLKRTLGVSSIAENLVEALSAKLELKLLLSKFGL
jgi:signal peptide peptidase SppA